MDNVSTGITDVISAFPTLDVWTNWCNHNGVMMLEFHITPEDSVRTLEESRNLNEEVTAFNETLVCSEKVVCVTKSNLSMDSLGVKFIVLTQPLDEDLEAYTREEKVRQRIFDAKRKTLLQAKLDRLNNEMKEL